ncbi:peptidase S8/S53 domain-containing protein [Clohesyomyces aquaticus]|uniref:Peptidase S8/S53 domain-containing protein n=1 Tax=Clohesyomyces aquaticus TaxID=1231657 RepID=A0A1Y1YEK2_9PLEO|nr:peptidase S8/S53 domain-containing protein [Clohesyomyces aquaticus]
MQVFIRVVALTAAAAPSFAQAAPVPEGGVQTTAISGKWIVQLKPEASIASVAAHKLRVREIHARNLARRGETSERIEHEYGFGGFKGYARAFKDAMVEELKGMAEVLSVEPDYEMKLYGFSTQSNIGQAWGLGSILSRTTGATDYTYDSSAGEGTFSYVVDTGVRITHNDANNNGHGTHVAGTIGGKTVSVSKKTTVIAVKVLDGDTRSTSNVLDGFNWAINDIVSKNRTNTAVINMSLGGPASKLWDSAMTASFAQGVLSVVASGNKASDVSLSSPSRSLEAITVRNVQQNNACGFSSNYGLVVDIFAARTRILSAWYTSDTAT